MSYQIGVLGSSQYGFPGEKEATIIGREIARAGCTLLTGGCIGFPYAAVKGAKMEGGITTAVSPASNQKEHVEDYGYPVENHDIMIYTGFGYKGRNVILVRSSDAVIAGPGRTGTLNELTIAYGDKKIIGLLKGFSGAADEFSKTVKKIGRPGRTIIESEDPAELIQKILRELER